MNDINANGVENYNAPAHRVFSISNSDSSKFLIFLRVGSSLWLPPPPETSILRILQIHHLFAFSNENERRKCVLRLERWARGELDFFHFETEVLNVLFLVRVFRILRCQNLKLLVCNDFFPNQHVQEKFLHVGNRKGLIFKKHFTTF